MEVTRPGTGGGRYEEGDCDEMTADGEAMQCRGAIPLDLTWCLRQPSWKVLAKKPGPNPASQTLLGLDLQHDQKHPSVE